MLIIITGRRCTCTVDEVANKTDQKKNYYVLYT